MSWDGFICSPEVRRAPSWCTTLPLVKPLEGWSAAVISGSHLSHARSLLRIMFTKWAMRHSVAPEAQTYGDTYDLGTYVYQRRHVVPMAVQMQYKFLFTRHDRDLRDLP